jgi:hypothetical protein
MKTLRPDVVRELGDATGDRAAIAGLGRDNQRQDAADDPGDGLANGCADPGGEYP